MTAVLHDDISVVVATPAPRLRVVADGTPPAVPMPKASKRLHAQLGGADPLIDGATRLLCIPLRQLYAALWRAGVLEVGV